MIGEIVGVGGFIEVLKRFGSGGHDIFARKGRRGR